MKNFKIFSRINFFAPNRYFAFIVLNFFCFITYGQFRCAVTSGGFRGNASLGTPNASCCVMYVKVNFHYVLRTNGTGNFTETTDGSGGTFNGYQHANALIAHMNSEFANNQNPFLPKPTPPLANSPCLQFVLAGVYFDRDNTAYNETWNIENAYRPKRINTNNEINIFFGRDSVQGDPTSFMAGLASGYQVNPNDAVALLYNVHNEYIRYGKLLNDPWWIHSAATTINHEIGHLTGLAHNIECPTGIQCPSGCYDLDAQFGVTDTYFPGFRCWQFGTPSCQPLCANWTYVGNYFMDYTAYEPAISNNQIYQMRAYFLGAGSVYRTNLATASFTVPSSYRLNSGPLNFSGSGSSNYSQYKLEIWKCAVGSSSCVATNLGNYYSTGIVTGTVPNINLLSIYTFQANNSYRITLTVYNDQCSAPSIMAKCVYILPPLVGAMAISPNPTSNKSTLSYNLSEDVKDLSISLFSTSENKVPKKELKYERNKIKGNYATEIDLSILTSGIYNIEIKADNSIFLITLSVIK